MNPITSILSGPLSGVIESVGNVLDKLTTSAEEKLAAQRELTKIGLDFQTKVLEVEADIVKEQSAVIQAEAKSASWIARNWRPILMLVFTYIIAHNYVLAPVFGITVVPIPDHMWELLKLGVGGYVIGRTAEKITPDIIAAVKKK